MSETNEKKLLGCSSFQAFEMENRTTKLEETSFHAEMQSRVQDSSGKMDNATIFNPVEPLHQTPTSDLSSTDLGSPLQTLERDEQEGTTILVKGNKEVSIRKQVKSNKKIVEVASPDWLPPGWRTEIRFRESGSTAGSKDKYYVEISTGCRCRSRPEVAAFLDSGKKKKPKSKMLGSGKNEAQSAALQSANSLTLSIPDLNSSPERLPNDLNLQLEYITSQRKSNVDRKQQNSASDGQKQVQEDSENLTASKMCGLDNSGNAVKRRIKSHPSTGKSLDNGLTSSFTPASQGRPHAREQNDKELSKIDGLVSTGEPVLPPRMFVTGISDEGPENTANKPSETDSRARERQCTEQSMVPFVSSQAGCHSYLKSHNQPCDPVMPLVEHQPSKGRPRSTRSVRVNPQELKRRLAELGRRLCKHSLGIAPSPSPAKSKSDTTS